MEAIISGGHRVIDLNNQFFLVQLLNEIDVLTAMLHGSWIVIGHCLLMQQWFPSFRASSANVSEVVTWVHFSNMQVPYYHEVVLKEIGNVMGKH